LNGFPTSGSTVVPSSHTGVLTNPPPLILVTDPGKMRAFQTLRGKMA
jgi:hypothetical protein